MNKSKILSFNWLFSILLIALIVMPFFNLSEYVIHVIILLMFYTILGLAWNIIGGFAGQLLLGQSVFVGLTGYTCLMLLVFFGIPIWIGMLISFGVVTAFSLFIGYPCLKLRGPFFALATISVAEAVKAEYSVSRPSAR